MSLAGTWYARPAGADTWLIVELRDADGVVRATVANGETTREFEIRAGERPGRVIVDGRPMAVEWRMDASGAGRLLMDGTPHAIELETNAEKRVRELRMRRVGEQTTHQVRAPMPGLVVAVHIGSGQHVTKDAPVAIIEAMKMENEIAAPAEGVVSDVAVEAGATIEQGALICTIEPGEKAS